MSKLKRFLGIVWIIIGLAAGYYLLISQAVPKFTSAQAEDRIPAIIYAFYLLLPFLFFLDGCLTKLEESGSC